MHRGRRLGRAGRAGAALRLFRPHAGRRRPPRAAIRPHVLCMSSGMREYSARGGARGELRLGDLPDLERYCYFVAGTVGELLTELFLAAVPMPDAARRAQICMRAVPFGLGLQLVNIVKDVAKDHARGVCYLPERLAAEQGVPLGDILLPERREAGMAVLRRLCARAREHLAEAEEYTLAWPLPAGAPVRLFCAVPLALALATLAEVERGTDALVPGRSPKVSRALVAEILGEAAAAGADDEALRRMLARWRGGG
ncbi:MAG: squalene/phytoene synthase family protein [Deltaproteobacteria bacterium]|nr:squalene/phytoene synthase family protein [Deltaproteobacteria bacterium]